MSFGRLFALFGLLDYLEILMRLGSEKGLCYLWLLINILRLKSDIYGFIFHVQLRVEMRIRVLGLFEEGSLIEVLIHKFLQSGFYTLLSFTLTLRRDHRSDVRGLKWRHLLLVSIQPSRDFNFLLFLVLNSLFYTYLILIC